VQVGSGAVSPLCTAPPLTPLLSPDPASADKSRLVADAGYGEHIAIECSTALRASQYNVHKSALATVREPSLEYQTRLSKPCVHSRIAYRPSIKGAIVHCSFVLTTCSLTAPYKVVKSRVHLVHEGTTRNDRKEKAGSGPKFEIVAELTCVPTERGTGV
jgi:hypothetical protein